MAKEKDVAAGTFRELFQLGVYKRSQGRIARQVTFAALATALALGLWRLSEFLTDFSQEIRFGVPGVLLLAGLWLCYRLVNIPKFADFLIAVEAEMNKVSWPTQTELIRSSIVVIFVIFFLATILFIYDNVWQKLLHMVGVH